MVNISDNLDHFIISIGDIDLHYEYISVTPTFISRPRWPPAIVTITNSKLLKHQNGTNGNPPMLS